MCMCMCRSCAPPPTSAMIVFSSAMSWCMIYCPFISNSSHLAQLHEEEFLASNFMRTGKMETNLRLGA